MADVGVLCSTRLADVENQAKQLDKDIASVNRKIKAGETNAVEAESRRNAELRRSQSIEKRIARHKADLEKVIQEQQEMCAFVLVALFRCLVLSVYGRLAFSHCWYQYQAKQQRCRGRHGQVGAVS